MRTAFVDTLTEIARVDKRIVLITGDLGFNVLNDYAAELPGQYLNAGVAEQNMTGIAAGMAMSGKVVLTYSIANFPTMRCLEQIRNDVCYHDVNVKVVVIGGGFSYGALGATHHATEDIAVMRALPGMTVVAPADPIEARAATRAIIERPGPCYLRLGKAGEPDVHPGPIEFVIGKAIRVRDGGDVTLISTGAMLQTVVGVAERLSAAGIGARVLSMHTIKPLDADAVLAAARETRAVVAIEEHSIIGGLGSAVAEILAETDGIATRFRRIGIPSAFFHHVGSQQYLRDQLGLGEEAIAKTVEQLL